MCDNAMIKYEILREDKFITTEVDYRETTFIFATKKRRKIDKNE